jgi:ribonuclease G
MSFDKTKHKILPPSKFGLIQITRQRVRPEMVIKTREPNPNFVNNSIEIEAPITVIEVIETALIKILKQKKKNKIQLNTHPFIAAYLKKGIPSIQHKWFLKHKKWIKISPRDAYQYLQFNFSANDTSA